MIKLYINESYYLSEDIEAVKKYYPNIDDDMFMYLISLDPTYRGNQSLGKYGKWILNLYNKGKLSDDDVNNITDVLNQFTTYRNRIANKDLNSYKTVADLEDTLANVVDDDSMLTDRQKVRFLKNVKSGKVKVSAEDDYDIVLETPNFIVYVPNTHEASMKLGKGTEWCTAHENPEWYDKYTKDGGKLYIIEDKSTGDKYQYSDSSHDFLDADDCSFPIISLLRQDRELLKFFHKLILDSDIEEPFIYTDTRGGKNRFLSLATNVVIADTVKKIPPFAFQNCEVLEKVTIPDSVTYIDMSAFANCIALKSIVMPDSIDGISTMSFMNCLSLQSVTLSNNIKRIGSVAFSYCKSLNHIFIPETVTYMGNHVFEYCPNLTVHTDNPYVTQYCNENNIPVEPITKKESYYKQRRYRR